MRKASFERFRTELESYATQYRTTGDLRKQEIPQHDNAEVQRILGDGERQSRELRGAVDARNIREFARAIEETGDFYTFQKTLELYREALAGDTRLILTTDSDLLRMLKGVDPAEAGARGGHVGRRRGGVMLLRGRMCPRVHGRPVRFRVARPAGHAGRVWPRRATRPVPAVSPPPRPARRPDGRVVRGEQFVDRPLEQRLRFVRPQPRGRPEHHHPVRHPPDGVHVVRHHDRGDRVPVPAVAGGGAEDQFVDHVAHHRVPGRSSARRTASRPGPGPARGARPTRFFCPPLNPDGLRCVTCSGNPTCRISPAT